MQLPFQRHKRTIISLTEVLPLISNLDDNGRTSDPAILCGLSTLCCETRNRSALQCTERQGKALCPPYITVSFGLEISFLYFFLDDSNILFILYLIFQLPFEQLVHINSTPSFAVPILTPKKNCTEPGRAAFIGTRIIFRQVSPESEAIYDLIIALYHSCNGNWKQLQERTGVTDQDLLSFQEYATQFLYNAGNYKGFGDSKFIPRLSPTALQALVSTTPKVKQLLESIGGSEGGIFANTGQPGLMHLGFPDRGHLSEYYPVSPNITKREIEYLGDFLAGKGLLPENTRLRKLESGDFEVLVAAGVQNPPRDSSDVRGETSWQLEGELKGKKLQIVYGDYQEEMAKIALHMKKAGLAAANEVQKQMMEEYTKSFSTGSLLAFKESQKHWVKDIGTVPRSIVYETD